MTASRGILVLSLLFLSVVVFPTLWRLTNDSGPPPLSATYVGGFVALLGLVLSFVVGGLEARIAKLEARLSNSASKPAAPGTSSADG